MNHPLRSITLLARGIAAALVALVVALPSHGGGGATGTGRVAQGSLTAFGSVFVNGIEFFTSGAAVVIDGVPGRSESELRIGMQLRVEGIVNPDGKTGSASTVEYGADLRGTVDGPAIVAGERAWFSVHGLLVRTDERTIFESILGPEALSAGDRVEVSGLRNAATGEIHATFVSRNATAPATVVSGTATLLDGGRFLVGSVVVDYTAAVLAGFPAGGIASGMVVRAAAPSPPVGGVLVASEVRLQSGSLDVDAGTEASAEGVVSLRSATAFSMGGLVVVVDAETRYRNGTAGELADGEVVEAEGIVQVDGSLLASRITFRSPDTASIQATVTAKDATGFRLVSAEGVRVEVTGGTRFRDKSRNGSGGFGWATLAVGDTVSVSGYEIARATILAASVTRVDPDPVIVVKARARWVDRPVAVVVGQDATARDDALYQDGDLSLIGADAFFGKAAGRRLKVRGFAGGAGTLDVFAMEIEK